MKKLIAALVLATLTLSSFAQDALPTVKVSAKGDDVRLVLHDLFGQAKKNYILDPAVRFSLYLSLADVEFEEALQLVCKTAGLKYELQNGIYFVNRIPAKVEPKPMPKQAEPPVEAPKPKGKLPESVLTKVVTTRLDRVDLRALFAELSKQTGVTIEVDKAVPAYKLDAHLIKTSLRYALNTVCDAANLKYVFTDNLTILLTVKKEGEGSKVVLKGQ